MVELELSFNLLSPFLTRLSPERNTNHIVLELFLGEKKRILPKNVQNPKFSS